MKRIDNKCPYMIQGQCGYDDINCIGCIYDPLKREMTAEMFHELKPSFKCGECKYHRVSADREETGVPSVCKRIDHKRIRFAVPWFYAYDCGQYLRHICCDFEPSEGCKWLYNHWKPEFLPSPSENDLVPLVLDGNTKVSYYVKAKDFFNNTFLNEDGSLKWVKKTYYKRSRKSPIGSVLVREFTDGRIQTHD